MELLPPVGWVDVATKEDLRQFEERMNLRFDILRSEVRGDILETLVRETHLLFRNLVVLCSSLVFAVGGLAFAAAKLT